MFLFQLAWQPRGSEVRVAARRGDLRRGHARGARGHAPVPRGGARARAARLGLLISPRERKVEQFLTSTGFPFESQF